MLSNQYAPSSPTLTASSQSRQPRALVLINGTSVLWTDITLTTTTFYVADSYHVDIPLNGQPTGINLAYWGSLSQFTIEIYIGFPSNPDTFTTDDLRLLLVGDCDEMSVDPLGATVSFSGRDLTSRLIDTKTFNKYPNQTASNIAIQLAQKHGLTPIVQPTSGNVGTLYSNQNVLMTKQTTEWDLLTYLAQQYGYVVYVSQRELIFAPKVTVQDSDPYVLRYQPPNASYGSPVFNGMGLNFTRSMTLSKDVTVKVRVPYSPLTGRAFTVSAGKTNPTINSTSAGNQIYTITIPGLTQEKAQAQAKFLLSQITLNEKKLTAHLPGDNLLTKASLIKVIGTNTMFDQNYYADTVVRRISYSEGYTMEIHAKNIDVNSQVSL